MIELAAIPGHAAPLLSLPLILALAPMPSRGMPLPPAHRLLVSQGLRGWVLPGLISLAASMALFVPALCATTEWDVFTVWMGGTVLNLLAWAGVRRVVRLSEGSGFRRAQTWLAISLPFGALMPLMAFLPAPWKLAAGRLFLVLVVAALLEVSLAWRAARIRLLDAEDAAARVRLSPHFLLNTLNGLQAQIDRDPEGAQATTEQLGRLFHQLLTLAKRPVVRLEEEVAFVEDLLALHRARLGDRLQVNLDLPEATLACELPTLALQTLVENALRHGIAPREEGGRLEIRARLEVTRMGAFSQRKPEATDEVITTPLDALHPAWTHLVIEVRNPLGPGTTAGTGLGLPSLRARLPEPEDLVVEAAQDRFTARLRWRQP